MQYDSKQFSPLDHQQPARRVGAERSGGHAEEALRPEEPALLMYVCIYIHIYIYI